MKTLFLIIIVSVVTVSAQFEIALPSESRVSEDITYCRGAQEVDENGTPIPDDPNCVPDPSTGGTGGIEGFFISWF